MQTEAAEIHSGNRTICEFTGGYRHDGYVKYYVGPDRFEHESGTFLKYDKTWDWLMPACRVWDFLSENGKIPASELDDYEALCGKLDDSVTRSYDILPAFKQLVECIEWYNSKVKNR